MVGTGADALAPTEGGKVGATRDGAGVGPTDGGKVGAANGEAGVGAAASAWADAPL